MADGQGRPTSVRVAAAVLRGDAHGDGVVQAPEPQHGLPRVLLRKGQAVRAAVKLLEKVASAVQALEELLDEATHGGHQLCWNRDGRLAGPGCGAAGHAAVALRCQGVQQAPHAACLRGTRRGPAEVALAHPRDLLHRRGGEVLPLLRTEPRTLCGLRPAQPGAQGHAQLGERLTEAEGRRQVRREQPDPSLHRARLRVREGLNVAVVAEGRDPLLERLADHEQRVGPALRPREVYLGVGPAVAHGLVRVLRQQGVHGRDVGAGAGRAVLAVRLLEERLPSTPGSEPLGQLFQQLP
mmetsp:Transcript_118124/g.368005  ORF Transcript_118124/g.368005 Transcript_118124/m.368005 type:complete len:296 (-) Transcript_118124:685-1572(-)